MRLLLKRGKFSWKTGTKMNGMKSTASGFHPVPVKAMRILFDRNGLIDQENQVCAVRFGILIGRGRCGQHALDFLQ